MQHLFEACEPRRFLSATVGADIRGQVSVANSDSNDSFKPILLPGYRVYLDLNHNGKFDALTDPSTRSNTQGKYLFSELSAGLYTVRIASITAGEQWTGGDAIPVDLHTSQDRIVNFTASGAGTTGTIRGVAFKDRNGNRQRDDDEPVFAKLPVRVSVGHGEIRNTITANDGTYIFDDVPAGMAYVQANATNYGSTSATVEVHPNQSFPGDLPMAPLPSIAVHFFNDLNENGMRDPGEPAIANQTVTGWVRFNDSDPTVSQSFVIDATGTASFRLNRFGTASIVINPPNGFQSVQATGIFRADVPAVANGSSSIDAAFTTRADISGSVADGQLTTRLAGWHVYLDLNHDGKLEDDEPLQTTDSGGGYSFRNVTPGTYDVRCILEDDAYVAMSPLLETYSVIPGNFSGPYFLFTKPNASIRVRVINDVDGDGGWRLGVEGGAAGFRVWIDLNNDGKLESNEPAARTDVDGNAFFTRLLPGTYVIRQTPVAGWSFSPAKMSAAVSYGGSASKYFMDHQLA